MLDFMHFLMVVCSTASILILRISDYEASHSKSRALYSFMGLHYERSTHQVFRPYSSSSLNSWVTCNVVAVVIAAVLVCFSFMCLNANVVYLFIYLYSGNPMGTGAESIVCLSVEWSVIRRILEERLLPFVMSALGKDD